MLINIGRVIVDPILEYVDNKDSVVEVGCWVGNTTKNFSKAFNQVFAVDPYLNGYDDKDRCSKANMTDVFKEFNNNIKGLHNVIHVNKKSKQAVSQ